MSAHVHFNKLGVIDLMLLQTFVPYKSGQQLYSGGKGMFCTTLYLLKCPSLQVILSYPGTRFSSDPGLSGQFPYCVFCSLICIISSPLEMCR